MAFDSLRGALLQAPPQESPAPAGGPPVQGGSQRFGRLRQALISPVSSVGDSGRAERRRNFFEDESGDLPIEYLEGIGTAAPDAPSAPAPSADAAAIDPSGVLSAVNTPPGVIDKAFRMAGVGIGVPAPSPANSALEDSPLGSIGVAAPAPRAELAPEPSITERAPADALVPYVPDTVLVSREPTLADRLARAAAKIKEGVQFVGQGIANAGLVPELLSRAMTRPETLQRVPEQFREQYKQDFSPEGLRLGPEEARDISPGTAQVLTGLGETAPFILGGEAAGAVEQGLARVAPRLAATKLGQALIGAVGQATLGAGVTAAQEAGRAALNPDEANLAQSAARVGESALGMGVLGAAGGLVGQPVEAAVSRALPAVNRAGWRGALSRAFVSGARGAATGASTAATLQLIRAAQNPGQIDLAKAARQVGSDAALFALIDAVHGALRTPETPRLAGEQSAGPQLGAYDFVAGESAPPAGATEFRPGSGIYVQRDAEGRQTGTYFAWERQPDGPLVRQFDLYKAGRVNAPAPETRPAEASRPETSEPAALPGPAAGASTPGRPARPLAEALEAPATKPEVAPALNRAQAIRDALPGVDERAVQQILRDTAQASDEEFGRLVAGMGKPAETPQQSAETPTKQLTPEDQAAQNDLNRLDTYRERATESPFTPGQPIEVYRRDEQGASVSTDKPHGLYLSLVYDRGTFRSPHEDAGNTDHWGVAAPQNPLVAQPAEIEHARFGRRRSGTVSAGVAALKQLLPEVEFERVRTMRKTDLAPLLEERFPGPDYGKYYDAYELLETYGAQLARARGYDAIVLEDPKMPEFSEMVALNDNILNFEGKQPSPTPQPLTTGRTATARTERGTAVETKYAAVDAGNLVTSHDTDLRQNPAYPQELQPRDRARAASEDQINRIIANLEPEFLGESPKASEGAPIVGPDLVVESGNGRTIALQRVYDRGGEGAQKYRAWLLENAGKFGLDPEAIKRAASPVLVRIRQTDVNRAEFAREANEQSVAAMSATEQAMADAKRLTPEVMQWFNPSESGELAHAGNRDFTRAFLQHVVGPAEQGRYVTADGTISQEGLTRIRNAVFARAYGDTAAIEKLAESPDNNVRNITSAMLVAAGRIARVREGIAAGRLYPVDLAPEIAAAMKKLSQLRESGESVEKYLAGARGLPGGQVSLFGADLDSLALDILDVFNRHKASGKKLAEILTAYADAVEAAGDPRQVTLFAGKVPTKAEVLETALRKVAKTGGDAQATLFEGAAGSGPATGSPAGEAGPGTSRPGEEGQGSAAGQTRAAAPGHLIVGPDNAVTLEQALDQAGNVGAEWNRITIQAGARISRVLAEKVRQATAGWDVIKSSDGSVTLQRPADGRTVREVAAVYERVGVRDEAEKDRAETLAAGALRDLLQAGEPVSTGGGGFPAGGAGNPGGIRTVAIGIQADLVQDGRISFDGKRVGNARELAVLAQVVRDPRYETFRIIYTKGDTVVATEAVTSRLPGLSAVFLEDSARALARMRQRMQRLQADGYWLLHNHPSGSPRPSRPDVEATAVFAGKVPGFKGHVVINSGKYGLIDDQGNVQAAVPLSADAATASDALLEPGLDHPLLGAPVTAPQDIVRIGAALKPPDGVVALFYRSADSRVRAIQEVPVGLFRRSKEMGDYIRGKMRAFGAGEALAYYAGSENLLDAARQLIKDRVLLDVIFPGRATLSIRSVTTPDPGKYAGLDIGNLPKIRVREEGEEEFVGPEFFAEPTAPAKSTQAMPVRPPSPTPGPGPQPLKPMQRKVLIDWLGKRFNVTLAKGHFREHALGIYKVKPEVIRTKVWGDLQVLAHEIGHHLDKTLNLGALGHDAEMIALGQPTSKKSYTKAQQKAEGVAEFLRLYLGDPVAAKKEAPGFYAAFEQRIQQEPGLAEVIGEAQDQFRAHLTASPREQIDAAISWNNKPKVRGTIAERIDAAANKLVDEWFDSNAAVRRAQERIAGRQELPVDQDAYLRLQVLPKLIPGRTEAWLHQWQHEMKPLGDRLEDYLRYADARAALWRAEKFGYDDSKLPFSKVAAEAYIKEVEARPDAQDFKAAFAREQQMFSDALQELKDAGVLDDEAIRAIEDAHRDYAPLFRDVSARNRGTPGTGRTSVNLPKGVLRQHGGGEPLLDPVERRIRYFARITGIAERNRVGQALAKFADTFEGAGKLMDEVPPPQEHVQVKAGRIMDEMEAAGANVDTLDPDATIDFFRPTWAKGKNDTIVTVYRDGKPVYYDVHDAGVLRAIAQMDPVTRNAVTAVVQTLASVYRTGATITPGFTIANLVRDTFESYILSHNQVLPGQALFEALRLIATKDPFVQRMIDSGLKQGGWLRPEKQSVQMLQQIANPKVSLLSPRTLWHFYQEFREQPEFWTRLGEASLEYRKRIRAGSTEEDAFLRALAEGGRITLNFTRGGYTARQVNRYVPFFKIPFEAGLRTWEAGREHPLLFALKFLLPAAGFALATVFLNRDNPAYREASDQERDKYLLVPLGRVLIRVPKPNGIFGVYQNLVERVLRQRMTEDPAAFRDFAKNALGELFPRVGNPALDLLVAYATGYSLDDGRPIMPGKEERLPPERQYNAATSPTARGIAAGTGAAKKALGFEGSSPRMTQYAIEKLIPGYSDGFFMLENWARQGYAAATGRGTPSPAGRPEDLPGIGRFISRPGEGKQGRSVGLFYDQFTHMQETYNGAKDEIEKRSGRPAQMDQLTPEQLRIAQGIRREMPPEDRALLANRKLLMQADEALSNLRKARDAADNSRTLTPEAKRRTLENINQRMTAVAQKALGLMQQAK